MSSIRPLKPSLKIRRRSYVRTNTLSYFPEIQSKLDEHLKCLMLCRLAKRLVRLLHILKFEFYTSLSAFLILLLLSSRANTYYV
jgi:hypothetical protein